MNVRTVFTALAVVVLASIVDGSLLSDSSAYRYLSCTVIALALLLFGSSSMYCIGVLVAGFVLEQYSSLPFGMAVVPLALASLIAWRVSHTVVTNRTPIALATITVSLTASFHGLDALGRWMLHLLGTQAEPLWLSVLVPWQLVGNVALALPLALLLGRFRTFIDPRIAPRYGMR